MKIILDEKLNRLSNLLDKPLYAVGGVVRNYLIDQSCCTDIDLSGPILLEDMIERAKKVGFKIVATYPRTNTVVLKSDNERYEFTSFRREEYACGGEHTPTFTAFTEDILEDAKRRDFKCNAIYYDIKNEKIVDPLGGIKDVENRVLDTVVSPKEVFSHDGLRLMRLARFAGELNFKPTDEVINSAKENADNIKDISPERIFDELKKILVCDTKNSFSDKKGHYKGLKILDQTRVLDRILPALTLGRGMEQRSDYHNYDVLEHSLRCVLYAPSEARLCALFHDIGKPFCKIRDGEYYLHNVEGEEIATNALKALKADKKTISDVRFIVRAHMIDLNGEMKEGKVRKFIVDNYDKIPLLLKIKQADYSASKDMLDQPKSVKKWIDIIEKMKGEGVPFSLKDLKITSKDLIDRGITKEKIGKTLKEIFEFTIFNPYSNNRETLIKLLDKRIKKHSSN